MVALRENLCQLGEHIEYEQQISQLYGTVTSLEVGVQQSRTELERQQAEWQSEREALIGRYEEQARAQRKRLADEVAAITGQEEAEQRELATSLIAEQGRLNAAMWQLSQLESSRGVRLVKLARASRAVLQYHGPLALGKRITLWTFGRRGYSLRDIPADRPNRRNGTSTSVSEGRKAIMFVSGVPDSAMRYRCVNQAEALGFAGVTTDVAEFGKVDLASLVDRYACFVLHRIPYGLDIESFMHQVRRRKTGVF